MLATSSGGRRPRGVPGRAPVLALLACLAGCDGAAGAPAAAGAGGDATIPGPATVRAAGTPLATPASHARVSAWASGVVEVFVNGVSVAKGATAGETVVAAAALTAGAENVVVLRATAGAASAPSLLAEVQGAFGRAGTSTRWKVKAASGTEATDATGPWAQVSYDDGGWSAGAPVQTTLPPTFPAGGPARGLWDGSRPSTLLARLRIFVPQGLDADRPQGFGHAVTGGAGGTVVRPTTLAELASALCSTRSDATCTDATPRVVEISKEFDFVGSEGLRTAKGCYGYTICSDPARSELLLDSQGQCGSKAVFDVTYDAAGPNPLLVGSNKTLLGVGDGARLRGKGLTLRGGVSNVIIRNVTLTEVNPQVVWGGDAITIDGADRVWIDHNRISLIGRQMLVTGWGKASNVTVSWNELDGQTPHAAYCDGAHYWVSLNLGSADTITLLGNWIHHTSGRGPHVGGYPGVNVLMHLVNNAWEDVTGHAINPTSTTAAPQSQLVAEGNHFARVEQPVMIDGNPGLIYAPAADAAACQAALGRACAANVALPAPSAGWPPPVDSAALAAVGSAGAGSFPAAFPASEVPNVVPHLAGVGHIGALAPAPDFSLAASPARVAVEQGATGTIAVTVTPASGFTGAVALGASGLPPGVSAAFSPASTARESTVTFRAAPDAAAGESIVTITGTGGGLSRTAKLSLTVSGSGTSSGGTSTGGTSTGGTSTGGTSTGGTSPGATSPGATSSGGAARSASCGSAGGPGSAVLGAVALLLATARSRRRR